MEAPMRRTVGLRYLEDSTRCIAAVRNGYSSVLWNPPRTHQIALTVASKES